MTDSNLNKQIIHSEYSDWSRLRNTGKVQFLLLFFIISTLSGLSCQQKKNSDIREGELPTDSYIKKIVYHFADASVPPQYHRSYTITVIPDCVEIVVNSYGEIFAKREYTIKKE